MQTQVPAFASLSGVVTLDSDASAATGVFRDGSGNSKFNQVSASEVKGTGFITFANHASVTGALTADTSAYLWPCDATGAAFTVTLPAVASCTGRRYCFKRLNSGANAVTLDGNGSETIDGATTYVLSAQWASATLFCDGTQWLIESKI